MSNVLFSVSDEREKLPTLRQWLNEIGRRKIASVYPVMCIWKPGTYGTVVFETESFRAIVYKGNAAYNSIVNGLDELVNGNPALGIVVNRAEPGKFEIVSMPNENPAITPIGEFGYRYNY